MSTLRATDASVRRPISPTHPNTTMRSTILTLALVLPLGLAACAEEPAEEVYEDNTTIVDEPMSEPMEEAYEEGAPAGDMEDVIGDGEIIDEPGEIEPDDPTDDVMEDAVID